jgi:hypothetical protein
VKTVVTASELARSLSDIMNRVVYRGEEFIVERNGQPTCQISRAGSFGARRTCTVAQFDNLSRISRYARARLLGLTSVKSFAQSLACPSRLGS